MPVLHTTFAHWKQDHPNSLMLSTDTGYSINYQRNPYSRYENTRQLMFRVSHSAPNKYHPKEQVLGIEFNQAFKAYPFSELSKQGEASFADEIDGTPITVYWNEEAQSAYIENEQGEVLTSTIGYWFAWYTFHPETEIFE